MWELFHTHSLVMVTGWHGRMLPKITWQSGTQHFADTEYNFRSVLYLLLDHVTAFSLFTSLAFLFRSRFLICNSCNIEYRILLCSWELCFLPSGFDNLDRARLVCSLCFQSFSYLKLWPSPCCSFIFNGQILKWERPLRTRANRMFFFPKMSVFLFKVEKKYLCLTIKLILFPL